MSPYRPARPCPGKGKKYHSCSNLIRGSERYCPDCQVIVNKENAKYDRERDQTEERHFLHSTQWRAIREAKLAQDPLCEEHLKQQFDVAAVMVHHLDENQLNVNDENLQSLCNNCHEEIHKNGRFIGNK